MRSGVVLPAPVGPRNPQIDPRGTVNVSPSGPYDLRSPSTSIAGAVPPPADSFITSVLLSSRKLGFEQTPDCAVIEAELAQPRDAAPHHRARLQNRAPVDPAPLRDERAGAVPQLYQAGVLHLPVSLGHRVWIHHEVLREPAYPRQLIAGPQRTDLDRVPHLLDQLQINRNPGLRAYPKHSDSTSTIVQYAASRPTARG